MTVVIKLPPEGLLLRDFLVHALAKLARRAGVEVKLSPLQAELPDVAVDDVTTKHLPALLEEASQRPPKIFQPDFKARDKVLKVLSASDLREAMMKYAEGLKSGSISSQQVAASWASSQVLIGGLKGALKLGADPSIPALQLFKANYYAGKRAFLPPRYLGADVYFDVHYFMLASVGASLARVGISPQGTTLYLTLKRAGAEGLYAKLASRLREVRCRTAPSSVFEVVLALTIKMPGAHPLGLVEVSEGGARPSILEYRIVQVDPLMARFASRLRRPHQLLSLLGFVLENWETNDRSRRVLVRVGHDLAQAVVLTVSGSMSPAEAFYGLARSTFATTSRDFHDALARVKLMGPGEFEELLYDTYEAIEACRRAP